MSGPPPPRSSAARPFALRLRPFAVLGLASLVVLAPLLLTGSWHRSHEEGRYLVLADLFLAVFESGVPYPRFLPDLYGGYGYPTFCFYPPGFFFWLLPFAWLPLPLHAAMQAALLTLVFAGGLGAYRLAGEIAGERFAWFGGLLFLLTPYLYVDLYVRGDLAELMAVLLCPWPVVWLLRLARALERGRAPALAMAGLAASLAALVYAHPVPALLLAPILATLVLALCRRLPQPGAFALRAAASALLAAAASAPYWHGVLALRSHVGFERLTQGPYAAELHGVAPWQLVSSAWGFGYSNPVGAVDGMSFQLGAIHLLLALVGGWVGRRSAVVRVACAWYGLLVVLMLESLRSVWLWAGPLRYLQFPWRLLSVTATLQVAAACGLQRATSTRLSPRRERALLVGILGLAALWHADQLAIAGAMPDPRVVIETYHRRVKPHRFEHFAGMSEFTPRTAARRPEQPRDLASPALRILGPGQVRRLAGDDPSHLRCAVEVPGPATLVIEQLYLPGWRVRVDGSEIPRAALERDLTPEGLMRVALPDAGSHRVEASYAGPPGGRLRLAALALALASAAPLARAPRRGPAGSGPGSPEGPSIGPANSAR